ncbi:MAG: PA2779 family protein [Syntrophales bacterium]|jgi:hypothetical protein
MVSKFRIPIVAMVMAVYISIFMCSPAIAGLISSSPSTVEMGYRIRGEEIGRIQKALENEILSEKLKAYGLSSTEIKDKLKNMTDEQIHMLAQASDRLLAGGDGLEVIIALLIIILLVIVILKLMHKEIVIK